ncbi:MAG: hypothetical protein GF393_08750 [Armatimonadia bacterium]|nr:hypothetical protein [Armatimonadia bacterium]
MRPAIIVVTLCVAIIGADAQGALLLHPCESLEVASIGMGPQSEETKLFVSHAAEHVTEGAGAIGAVSLAPDTPGNTYVSIYLSIEPTDFTDRALVVDAASSTPERSKAFYVRGYAEDGDMVLSWQSWEGRLTAEAQQFALVPGADSSGLRWEPQRVEDDDHSEVVRLEFITGTGEKDVHYNVTVDNVRVIAQ